MATTALESDSRAPVIYLRSFAKDSLLSRRFEYEFGSISVPWIVSEEEQLASVFSAIGPFVAVGRPNETRPPTGASRVYLPPDEWQQTVSTLIQQSLLTVLWPDLSAGVEWELREAIRQGRPERLILLIPDPTAYEQVRGFLNSVLPKHLPAERDVATLFPPGDLTLNSRQLSIRGVIYFDADWTPSVSYLKNDYWLSDFIQPLVMPLYDALAPIRSRLGREQGPAPRRLLPRLLPLAALLAFVLTYPLFNNLLVAAWNRVPAEMRLPIKLH